MVILMTACTQKPPSFEDRVQDLPSVLTGILETQKIDLYQQGTHQLETNDGQIILLQSSAISLNRYVGKRVSLKGAMNDPEDQTKPVFNVTEIELVDTADAGAGDAWQPYEDKRTGLRFEVPPSWEIAADADRIVLRSGGQERVTITVISTEKFMQEVAKAEQGKEGAPVTVGGQTSWRYTSAESIHLYVPNPSRQKIYRILFASPVEDPAKKEAEIQLFFEFLNRFNPLPAEKVTGDRCAGPAKLKCPEGYRCELYSTQKDAAGVCVLLSPNPLQR